MEKEQSSILTPNNKLVGVKSYKRRTKITKTNWLETFSFTFQNERKN